MTQAKPEEVGEPVKKEVSEIKRIKRGKPLRPSRFRLIPRDKEGLRDFVSTLAPKHRQQDNWWEKTIWGILLVLVVLMPLWFLPFTGLEPSKRIFLVGLTGAGLIFWLYGVLSQGQIWFRKTRLNLGVLSLLIILGLNIVFSQSWRGSLRGFWDFLVLGVVYWLFTSNQQSVVRTQGAGLSWRALAFWGLLGSIFLVIIFTSLQLLGVYILPWGFTKSSGFNTIGTVNSVGILAGFSFVVSLSFVLRKKLYSLPGIVAAFLALVSFSFLLFLSFRPVWWGIGVAMFAVLMGQVARQKKWEMRNLGPVLAVLILSIFLGLMGFNIGIFKGPLEVSPSFAGSLGVVRDTLKAQPWFGSGLNTFSYDWAQHRSLALNQTIFWPVRFGQGASAFLTGLAETGYLGTLVMIGFLGLMVWQGARVRRTSALWPGIIFLIAAWFFYPFNLTLWFLLFVGAGLLVVGQKRKHAWRVIDFRHPPQKASVFSLVITLVLVAALFGIYFAGQDYWARVWFTRGVAAQDLDESINKISRAVWLDRNEALYLRGLSQAFLDKINQFIQQGGSADQNQFSVLVSQAVNSARRATLVEPNNSLNWVQQGRVYEALIPYAGGAFNFARDAYTRALRLDPMNPGLPVAQARVKLLQAGQLGNQISILRQAPGQDTRQQTIDNRRKIEDLRKEQESLIGQALDDLGTSLRLKPDYAPAHFLMVQIYDLQGKIDEAIRSAANLVIIKPQDAGAWFRLGLLYYKKNDLRNSQAALEQAVKISDTYSNARYFLGLIYWRQNQREKAISEFQKIAELNPDNKEVEKILDNLRNDQPPLTGIVPPAQRPEQRKEPPVKPEEQLP